MSVFSIFNRKQPRGAITEELRKKDVKDAISEFLGQHAQDTDGLILIYASKGKLYIDAGGIDTEAEARGILAFADDMIRDNGLPR